MLALHGLDVLSAGALLERRAAWRSSSSGSSVRPAEPVHRLGPRAHRPRAGPRTGASPSRPALAERAAHLRAARRADHGQPCRRRSIFDNDASASATVVEVHAARPHRRAVPHHPGARRARPRHPHRQGADARRQRASTRSTSATPTARADRPRATWPRSSGLLHALDACTEAPADAGTVLPMDRAGGAPKPTCCAGARRSPASPAPGLGFTESLYERERFEEVLAVAADMRAAAADELDDRETLRRGVDGVGRRGRAGLRDARRSRSGRSSATTPGEILLVQRADSGIWLYPTGWADIGYSAVRGGGEGGPARRRASSARSCASSPCSTACASASPASRCTRWCSTAGPSAASSSAHPLECARRRLVRPRTTCPSRWPALEQWGELAFAAIRGEPLDVLLRPAARRPRGAS